MKSTVVGTTMPILEVTVDRGEAIVAEGGDVSWFTPGFDIETSTRFASGSGRGFIGGLKRMLGGGQLFLTQYTAQADGRLIALSANLPGEIRELRIDPSDSYLINAGAYIASTADVEVSVAVQQRLGAGIFGGAGVVFQKLSGNGLAWVQIAGGLLEYELGPGESFFIHPGHLAMFRSGMELKFASIRGVKNKIFGDTLFMAELHGPGKFWVQSMTVAKLAAAIQPYLADDRSKED